MIEITMDDVRSGLEALVAEKGEDYVYPKRPTRDWGDDRCVYVWEGQPDCIVGCFLAAKGVPIERLAAADENGGRPAWDLVHDLILEGVLDMTIEAWGALSDAQYYQDSGRTWGESLRRALKK